MTATLAFTKATALVLYGEVGTEILAADVAASLKSAGGRDVTINLFSYGGSAAEGLAIYDQLARYSGRVTVVIDGVAASAASLLAMAADRLVMPSNALLMIHDPWQTTAGNAASLRTSAEMLDSFSASYRATYARKTGASEEQVTAWMAAGSGAGTWFSAAEALEAGLADEVTAPAEIKAAAPRLPAGRFQGAPEALAQWSDQVQLSPFVNPTMTINAQAPQAAEPSAAELRRENDIRRCAAQARLEPEAVDALVANGKPFADVALEIVSAHAAVIENRAGSAGHPARIGGWSPNGGVESLTSRLVERFHGRGSLTMPEILEATTQRRGRPADLLPLALSTSDFPELFSGAGNRFLRETYEAADSGARMLARRRVSPDLRDIRLLGLSEFPQLAKLLEGGEITYGSFEDRGGAYRVEEYARGISMTRRALLSDDLEAFQQALGTFGRAVALLEDSLVVTALETGGTGAKVLEDNVALFHASHSNTTTATGLTETSLAEATKRLREQTAPGIAARLNLTPKLLMVPAAVEVTARKLVASITPAATADASPFAGGALSLEVMVDANLGGTHCYVAVTPGSPATALELCEGPAAVDVQTQNDFETTGIKTRVLADRGLGVRDYRGICRIPLS